MTTCYFVSDLHGDKKKYELLAREITRNKPPFLFLGGDLLPHMKISEKQKDASVNPFFEEFMFPLFKSLQHQLGCNYPEVYLIAGNDDYKSDLPGFIEGVKKDLWKFLNNSKVKFGPYHIYGYSYVPPTPFRIKDWEKYDIDFKLDSESTSPDSGYKSVPDDINSPKTIAEDLNLLINSDSLERSILIMHSPPYNSALDKISGGKSIGSRAIADLINSKQPYITLHGHAHETVSLTGNWHTQFNRTHSFSAAHDGEELAIIIFQIDNPAVCERRIIK
ncbi:MAG TPA: metallophosphoesterase [Lentimicrobium sp.]|nr:metallophosphoesterase [Lentimicrobium sp.]